MLKTLSAAAAAILLLAGASLAAAHGHTLGNLRIGHPWAFPAPAGALSAAGYFTVTNNGTTPDKFLGATVADASKVEIHSMTMQGGIMRMRPVTGGVVVPPGQTLTFAPGAYHLMLIGPKRAFVDGGHIMGVLHFEKAGDIAVDFHVQATAPSADHGPMDMSGGSMGHMDMGGSGMGGH